MAKEINVVARKWWQPVLVASIGLLLVVNGVAQQRSKSQRNAASASASRKPKGKRKTKKRRPPFRLTAKTEKAALSFVRKHHRELEELLIYLKENKKQAYHRAIRDLWRANERLTGIRRRSPQRYNLELKIWQADSKSKVLAARFVMTRKESIAEQLRDVLKERAELKRKSIALEKSRLKKRMERLQGQIDRLSKQIRKLDKNTGNDVDRRFRLLTQQRKRRPSRKVSTKTPKRRRKPETKQQ